MTKIKSKKQVEIEKIETMAFLKPTAILEYLINKDRRKHDKNK